MGPKPASDPAQWCQASRAEPLGGGPPDVLHYSPCINHPAWREYLDLVVRQLAGVGYDGMFFDVNTLECFFAEHADLWQGGTSWARVGLLFWNDQVFYEHTAHLAMVHRLVQVLAEAQVPFDLVTEEGSRVRRGGQSHFCGRVPRRAWSPQEWRQSPPQKSRQSPACKATRSSWRPCSVIWTTPRSRGY